MRFFVTKSELVFSRKFRELSKKHTDSNKIKHLFLSFSITMEQSIYEQNISVCVSSSSKDFDVLIPFSTSNSTILNQNKFLKIAMFQAVVFLMNQKLIFFQFYIAILQQALQNEIYLSFVFPHNKNVCSVCLVQYAKYLYYFFYKSFSKIFLRIQKKCLPSTLTSCC
jgi:hypothetical protein